MKDQKNLKIFIVDDDPYWIELLKELLHSIGYSNTTGFESGDECMKNINLQPDIIFLDYEMAKGDGISTLKLIKEFYADIYVIFATAKEDINVAVKAMRHGSFDYLLKTNVSKKEIQDIFKKIASSNVKSGNIY
jgi:DNA-binding NtrC family response regulator